MPSFKFIVSDTISLTLTLKDLGLRKFCMKSNILPSIPGSFRSNVQQDVVSPCYIVCVFYVEEDGYDLLTVCLNLSHCGFQ